MDTKSLLFFLKKFSQYIDLVEEKFFAKLWLDQAMSKEDFYSMLEEEKVHINIALSKQEGRFRYIDISDPKHQALYRDQKHQLQIIKFYEELSPSTPLYFSLLPFKGFHDWLTIQWPILPSDLKPTILKDRKLVAPSEKAKELFNQVLDLVERIYLSTGDE